MRPGESATLLSAFGHEYTFTHVGVSQYDQLNRFVSAASVEVTKGGDPIGIMTSEKRQYWDSMGQPTFQPSTEPAIRSGLLEDLYITYAGSVDGTEEAVYRFSVNPLVWWLWFGGFVLVASEPGRGTTFHVCLPLPPDTLVALASSNAANPAPPPANPDTA